jgi:hypothetical protein
VVLKSSNDQDHADANVDYLGADTSDEALGNVSNLTSSKQGSHEAHVQHRSHFTHRLLFEGLQLVNVHNPGTVAAPNIDPGSLSHQQISLC